VFKEKMQKLNYILVLFVMISAGVFSQQSYINSVLGRYVGETTYLNGSTPIHICDAHMMLTPDVQYNVCVREGDSCYAQYICTTWCTDPWNILVNADSTLIGYEPWTVSAAATGRLYANDSIYLKVKRFGDQTTWREFRGFKLYSTVGVKELNNTENELLISPQPASDAVYIQSTQLVFRQEDIPVVYDISGKQCTIPTQYINKNTYKLDVIGLSAGMYVIAIKTEQGIVRKKVIVE
jgi:hypothetical protein